MIDTDVLIYAASKLPEHQRKAQIAIKLSEDQDLGLSAQVLQELIVASTAKVRKV